MISLRTFAALCIATLAACAEGPTGPSTAEITNAPVEIRVAGVGLTLEAYLFRDYAPVSPADGKPLIASVRLKATDGKDLPADLRAETFYVIYGEQVWTPDLVQEWPSTSPGDMELVARNGPKWPTGSTVDVVLRLRHGNTALLLKAAGQQIHRTD